MISRIWLGLICLTLLTSAQAREEDRSAPSRWTASVVTVDIARAQHDYYQPWSKSVYQAQKVGIVIANRQILTTANDLFDRTLVRLQKAGRGRWWIAQVTWIDYHANLALLTAAEPEFWQDTKPVALARTTPRDGKLQVLRWRDGNLQSFGAEFNRYAVRDEQLSQVSHVVLEANSEIQGAGWGEPMVANSHLVGLVRSQEGRTCIVTPVSFIQSILEARNRGEYHGLGYFDFYWQRAENPASLEKLALTGKPRGVIVIDVPERWDGVPPVLQPRDLILQIDGFDIDTQGDYEDPEFGHLMLENLSTRHKWAGADFKMQIWRAGKPMEITYRLPKFEYTNSLVPMATFDQEPEYLILGGLVFQPLTGPFLRSWGPDWRKASPFRLNYYTEEPPTKNQRALVFLPQVLPDDYNLGYQDQRGLVLAKANGQDIQYLADLREALKKPMNGFHILEFSRGDLLQRIVLAAGKEEQQATQRVLERYGIDQSCRLAGAGHN